MEFNALEREVYNPEKVRRKSRDRAKAATGDGSACPGREDETQGTPLSVSASADRAVFSGSPRRALQSGVPGVQRSPWRAPMGCAVDADPVAARLAHADAHASGAGDRHDRVSCLFSVIESRLLPRLLGEHRTASRLGPARASAEDFDGFFGHLTRDEEAALESSIARLLARGVAMEAVFADLLVAAHDRLAATSVKDTADLVAQTVAVGRLHELLRRHAPAFQAERQPRLRDRRILLVSREGDLHGFGMSLVGEFFRHAGWDVVVSVEADPAVDAQRVRSTRYDVVGLWVGHAGLAAWAREVARVLRRCSCHEPLVVMANGPWAADPPQRLRELGADLHAGAVRAPSLADNAVRWHRQAVEAGRSEGAILRPLSD